VVASWGWKVCDGVVLRCRKGEVNRHGVACERLDGDSFDDAGVHRYVRRSLTRFETRHC